jgi:hypothetical protein
MNRFLSFLAAVAVAVPLLGQTETERVLLPVFTPPVHGARGSEFHTAFSAVNSSENMILLVGLDGGCTIICIPGAPAFYNLRAGEEIGPGDVAFNGNPGRFVYVPVDQIESLAMNLRVFDVTHDAQNFGTEIPIVRERDFVNNKIVLTGVPTDPRFRNTLRIYSAFAVDVLITVGNQPPVRTQLKGGGSSFPIGFPDLFVPAYAAFSSFPNGTAPVRVTIEADPGFLSLLPIEVPLWAFVTVTNNETQAITTITPHP